MSYDLGQEIRELKKKKNVSILAHFYQDGAIQELADHVGDSYFLAQQGQKEKSDIILLAGVVFMAESVKILNPTKTVLVPDTNAGCSLVDSSPFDKYYAWRMKNPEAIAVTYINSSAEVKSISDVIITSSNAEKIINSIPRDRKILFGPDQHLGNYLSKKLNRPMEMWNGSCQVHVLFNARRLHELMSENPEAVVIAHPECEDSVLQYADVIGSTSRLLEEVTKNPAKKFIIATETGIFHQMKKARPDAQLIQAPVEDKGCLCNDCPFMKLNDLEKVKNALVTLQPEVSITESIRIKAQVSLDRMMKIAQGESVSWPKYFS